jgi:pyruvate kinase
MATKTEKKTKIVATIGPSSESEENLKKMIKAGMNVTRLNFSHGEYSWHRMAIKRIKKVSKELGVNVGILVDLQGPKIRVNTGAEIAAKKGDVIHIYEIGADVKKTKETFIFIDKIKIIKGLNKGQEILIEDGLIKLKVIEIKGEYLKTKVIDAGIIKNHKGVNIPGADLDIDVITKKDKRDLDFVLEHNVDFVALSFVKNGKNIKDLRRIIKNKIRNEKNLPQIISKIERQEAIDNLDEILEETDAVMVARGDLGIEMDESMVVILQKEIISKSIKSLKPVIVATQMLGSMEKNPRPTRAEVSDVSNAVIDHADAVMLSGESATGDYPVESISIMTQIIKKTEESAYDDIHEALPHNAESEYALIVKSAYELAKSFDAQGICMISISGFTARLVSHFRPDRKIFVVTNNKRTFNQLSLLWGVEGYIFNKKEKLETLIDKTIKEVKNKKRLKKGDKVVIIMGRFPKEKEMRLIGVKKIR